MSTNILYFSRSGHTKKLAHDLSKRLSASVYEVKDTINYAGILGFFRALSTVPKDVRTEISYDAHVLSCDHLIIMSPIWGGLPVPAIDTFLKTCHHHNISLVLSNLGSDISICIDKAKLEYSNVQAYYGITRNKRHAESIYNHILQDKRDVY